MIVATPVFKEEEVYILITERLSKFDSLCGTHAGMEF